MHQFILRNTPWLTIILLVVSTAIYVENVIWGEGETVLVTWLVTVLATTFNLGVVFLKNKRIDFGAHSTLVVAFFTQSLILLSVILEDASIDFTGFHAATLLGSLIGFGIFLRNRNHALISTIAINSAALIGFIPMWTQLANGGLAEALFAWILVGFAGLVGVFKTWVLKDYLALTFPFRIMITGASVSTMTAWNMYNA